MNFVVDARCDEKFVGEKISEKFRRREKLLRLQF
jgi:hypothetical protein